jgi:hypothetical protein
MQISSKIVRAALLTLALALSWTALGHSLKAGECENGTNRYIYTGECCYAGASVYAKKAGQSCIFGVWTDNGAVKCEGPCPV